jgi:hypothetical protein
MSAFSEQVPIFNEVLDFLPAFHTCDLFRGRTYIENKLLQTKDICEVFEEPITYLFYGRPAFKYSVQPGLKLLAYYPICFVFDIDLIGSIKRLYPFDTGALFHKILNKFIHDDNVVAHFELQPEKQRISDVVMQFYGNNRNYLAPSLKDKLSIDPLHFESGAYKQMHDPFASDKSDERRVTIEIQADQEISLSEGALQAVIVPSQLLDSDVFSRFLKAVKCDVRSYEIDVWDPSSSFPIVAQVAKQYVHSRLKP